MESAPTQQNHNENKSFCISVLSLLIDTTTGHVIDEHTVDIGIALITQIHEWLSGFSQVWKNNAEHLVQST